MKLLMIFPSTIRGGVEEYNLTVTSGAVKEGWDVHVAFPKTEGTTSLIQDFTAQGVNYHQLEIAQIKRYWLPSVGKHMLDFARTLLLLFKLKPKVVQITLPNPSTCFGSILACAFLKIPTAVRFGLVPPHPILFRKTRLKAYSWARAMNQKWICISKNNQELVSKFFQIPKHEILCIYNGTKITSSITSDEQENKISIRHQICKELGLVETDILALTVGRLHPQKGYITLIPTIPHIIKEFPNVKFVWVGEGDRRTYLYNEVHKINVEDSVIFLGYRSDVPKLLMASDFFIFPSHYEGGQSFAINEAMAYGLPIITSDASGIPEIIQSNVDGLICRTGDSCSLLEAIRWALRNPEKMQQMAKNAQIRIQDFPEKKMIEEYIDIYKTLSGINNYSNGV